MSDDIIIERQHDGKWMVKELLMAGFQPGVVQPKYGRRNDTKLLSNIRRAVNTIMYIVKNNEWDYFVTFTIKSDDLAGKLTRKVMQVITQFIRNEGKRLGVAIKYLLIPEKEQDGRLHIHGLMAALPISELRLFSTDEPLPASILTKLENGQKVYDWPRFSERFGFSDVEVPEFIIKIGIYMLKKVLDASSFIMDNYNGNIYYASQGLNREPDRVLRGKKSKSIEDPDFENMFCRGKVVDNLEDAMEYLDTDDVDSIIVGKPPPAGR